ncbi:hypothetical protein M3T53_09680 [Actinomyces sp. B33]|uniref:hypothetical protein n=1 Tax=Actinomyces sp. B33 TaxID=2942131 RepID=UPI0023401475|nr:hypothetical protein [Actinomyces sp. B33]MDC4233961.1 hypothetical protein [Actinomyces sp. B33]
MANTQGFDTDKLRVEAQQLLDAAAVYAGRAAVKAADLAEQGVDWAAPRAQAALNNAIERATPMVEEVADRAQSAVDRARPAIEQARHAVVDDYLPRVDRAVTEGSEALKGKGSLADRARKAGEVSAAALTTPTPKVVRKHRFLRAIGWTALAGTVAGAGYVLWKRSQPIEDPWAEEYWADLETDSFVPETAPEALPEALPEAASDAPALDQEISEADLREDALEETLADDAK